MDIGGGGGLVRFARAAEDDLQGYGQGQRIRLNPPGERNAVV